MRNWFAFAGPGKVVDPIFQFCDEGRCISPVILFQSWHCVLRKLHLIAFDLRFSGPNTDGLGTGMRCRIYREQEGAHNALQPITVGLRS